MNGRTLPLDSEEMKTMTTYLHRRQCGAGHRRAPSDLRALGPANFLYADGDALFAHGHRRMELGKARPEPPGLWVLQRHCTGADASP